LSGENIVKISADVVIIGGSASGLPAAIRAVEAGAKEVVLLDKTKQMGGCARLAAGMFAVESPAQKRLGVHTTADECFHEHMELHNWRCDAMLVRKWMLGSGEAVRWLEGKGAVFNDVSTFNTYTGKRVYHGIKVKKGAQAGNEIVKALINECDRIGVQILREVRAAKLTTNENGAVAGVSAYNIKDGTRYEISAGSVVIATGAISSNGELVRRFMPFDNHDETKIMTKLPHNTGDGFIMAEEVGAACVAVGALLMGPHNHPNNIRVGLVIRRPHPMTVNKNGERFTDETLFSMHPFSWFAGQSLDMQPGKVCYPIYDRKILTDMCSRKVNYYGLEEGQGRIKVGSDMTKSYGTEEGVELEEVSETEWFNRVEKDIQSEAEKGRVKIADTLDEIAEWIGAEPAVLKATVGRYNMFCKNKYDRDFLKDKDFLFPIENPPYYCFIAHQGIDTIIGPLKINHNQQVINKQHKPIPGLYAAGVCTGGWVNNTYSYPGSCLGYSVYSGYAAGKTAGEYAVNKLKIVD
jgi:fumarate reductase flavoprotein subunit